MYINNRKIIMRRFSSGEMKLLYNDLIPLAENNQIDIIHDGSIDLFELMILVKFYKDNNIIVNLYLTYLPYQRMDHNNGYEAPTLRYVADIINSLEVNSLIICEPHCDINLFNNATKISFVDKIFTNVKKEINFTEDDYLIFTDKGSRKRYEHLGRNHVHFEKKRDKTSGLISNHEMIGEIKSNKAIIVDDIISSGDTIASCLDLIDNNIELYIICGHFERNKYNQRLLEDSRIKKIYSTNSLTKTSKGKLKLLDTKELINGKYN